MQRVGILQRKNETMYAQPNTLVGYTPDGHPIDPRATRVRSKQQPPRKTCPYCGERVRLDSPWCHSCGRNLIRPQAAKAPEVLSSAGTPLAPAKNRSLRNPCAAIGLVLGIVSIALYEVGIVPMVGLVSSVAGRILAGRRSGKGRIQAEIGIALNVLYLVMFVLHLCRYF